MEETKGRARIIVPGNCMPKGAKIPVFGECAFDAVKIEGQFDLWKKHLKLPENYGVIGVFYDLWHIHWCILVESAIIPPAPLDEYPPQYMAIFKQTVDGEVEVTDIISTDIVKRKDKE